MIRFLSTSQRFLIVALAVTLLLALLPARMPPGRWMGSVGEVIRLPMRPFEHGGRVVRMWLRPPQSQFGEFPPDVRERLDLLAARADDAEVAKLQADARIAELEDVINQLQQTIDHGGRAAARLLIVRIDGRLTGGSRNTAVHVADVKLPSGHSVTDGAIAVHGGAHLVGRLVNVGALRAELVALTDPSTPFMRCVVMPADRPDVKIEDCPVIQIEPDGKGSLTGSARVNEPVRPGDLVRLSDTSWPDLAQMHVIGTVTAVEPRNDQPLRVNVTVGPRHRLRDLSRVVIKSQPRAADGEAAP